MDNCGNCRFWFNQSADEGVCRRHASTAMAIKWVTAKPKLVIGAEEPPIINEVIQIAAAFPPMAKDGWCGDHEPALAQTKEEVN